VFHPVPNVDSVLLHMRRVRSAPSPRLRALVGGAFAHRRKTLAGSLMLAGQNRGHTRTALREALGTLGHPADVRAERLSPEDFRELDGILQR
jgi:16S rRNA (adenine1518-N6/adenine1519-N6)-dimethyltransferase